MEPWEAQTRCYILLSVVRMTPYDETSTRIFAHSDVLEPLSSCIPLIRTPRGYKSTCRRHLQDPHRELSPAARQLTLILIVINMFGARLFTFFTAALAGSTIVSAMAAGPVVARSPGSGAVEAIAAKRQTSIEDQTLPIIQKLVSDTAPSISSIKALTASGSVTQDEVTPLIQQITASLNTAAASLATVDPTGITVRSLMERQDSPTATALAAFIQDLATALDGLLNFLDTLPLLGGLLSGLDIALNQVLLGLSILLAGVLNLLSRLLSNVSVLLSNLALGLTLGTLGL